MAINFKFLYKSSLHSPERLSPVLTPSPGDFFPGAGRRGKEENAGRLHSVRGGSVELIDFGAGRGEPRLGLETEGLRARWREARPRGATSREAVWRVDARPPAGRAPGADHGEAGSGGYATRSPLVLASHQLVSLPPLGRHRISLALSLPCVFKQEVHGCL